MLNNVFSNAILYQLFQRAVGGSRARVWTIERYIRLKEGDAVLDLGCGPGDSIPLLMRKAAVRYVGLDVSAQYLERAKRYQAKNVSFYLGDCTHFPHDILRDRFDWIICLGLLHHLTDDQCDALLSQAASVLSSGGAVICLEPTFRSEQSWLTHAVMKLDRGKHVRWAKQWRALYERHFRHVELPLLAGAFRIPYEKTVGILRDPLIR